MIWKTLILLFLAASLSCTEGMNSKAQETSVLSIGSQNYSQEQFSRRLLEKARNFDLSLLRDGKFSGRLKQDVIRELTVEGLLLLWEPHLASPITPKDFQSEILRKQAQYPSAKAYRHLQKSMGIHQGDFERRVRAQLIKEALVASFHVTPKIDFKKVKQQYWADKESFMEDSMVKVQQIVTTTEHEASTILQALKKGADFGALAKKYSIAEEASSSGRLGWIGKGILPVFDAAFKLPAQRTSSIHKSPYGFHIMKVLEKKRRRKVPLDEVKEQMSQKSLQAQRSKLYKDWLENQLIAVPIRVNSSAIESAEIQTQRNYE